MTDELKRPAVGVAVVVEKDGKILMGKDHHKQETAVYAFPGGHWENGETLLEGAMREVLEESGIVCNNLRLISVYDFFRPSKQRSYVSIWFRAQYVSGDPRDASHEGREAWGWYEPSEALKLPVWEVDQVLIRRYMQKRTVPYGDD